MLNGDVPRWQSIHLRNQDIFTFRFLFGFCLVDVGDGVPTSKLYESKAAQKAPISVVVVIVVVVVCLFVCSLLFFVFFVDLDVFCFFCFFCFFVGVGTVWAEIRVLVKVLVEEVVETPPRHL